MKNTFLTIFLLVSSLFTSCAATSPKTSQQIIASINPSLLKITHMIDDEHQYVCTGFIIDAAKGLGLTAEHCVVDEEGTLFKEVFVNGMPTEVVKVTESLALIKIPAMIGPPLDLKKDKTKAGEKVIAVGYGFGDYAVVIRHISNPNPKSGGGLDISLDGPLAPGMSGGPVVDMDGKVVGVIQRNSQMNIFSLLCGADEIKGFLKAK